MELVVIKLNRATLGELAEEARLLVERYGAGVPLLFYHQYMDWWESSGTIQMQDVHWVEPAEPGKDRSYRVGKSAHGGEGTTILAACIG